MSLTLMMHLLPFSLFFFFNDTATTEIYTLSLHDALPIWPPNPASTRPTSTRSSRCSIRASIRSRQDRKSTRLNSSHSQISYAVFCLKKKKKSNKILRFTIHDDTLSLLLFPSSTLPTAHLS